MRLARGDGEALLLVRVQVSVIEPPGRLRQWERTTSSSPSCAVAVNVIDSPVAGLENSKTRPSRLLWCSWLNSFVGMREGAVSARYQSTVVVIAAAAESPRYKGGLVLRRVEHEGLVELVGMPAN